ncbi:MAG: hypothetical protein KKA65_00860 [Nanoarchaeota archaeon]|nr:hypothetical protein [Nanoarchaeota archaeon]MBU4242249.1 hypothetical protein [Nanoarchaeota archaeon]MBU4352272.1 hypothetical protein [Nanoarchaeota archaeon]MBU4456028.1 hypothetical protein [Nanoarchaeota archaeon]MCG2719538.1 hypothetical protein [Nanoarchaeota archaeon]
MVDENLDSVQMPPAPSGMRMPSPSEEGESPSEEMQISAINQEEEIPVPSPTSEEQIQMPSMQMPSMPQQSSLGYDEMQSIVEEIIDEKWRDLVTSIGDVSSWKSQFSDDLEGTKQEVLRLQSRFDAVQAALTGKVSDYESAMRGLSQEMKALEQVFGKILEPLTSNIKELKRITEDMREKHK